MRDYTETGLTNSEVIQSRNTYGSNRLTVKKRMGLFRQFLSNFGDPIIKVLLAALAINVLFLIKSHEWYESVGIAIAVFLATAVSTLSEYGSESAFEKLQEEASEIYCRVKRDGTLQSILLDEVVVGDMILLQSGDRVPADGVLLTGEITVDQSALNGESVETKKHPDQLTNDAGLESVSHVFRGSVVCSGECVMRVTGVGDATFYGSMAIEIQDETRESPLKVRLSGLAKTLSRLGFVAAGCVAFSDLFHSFVMTNKYSLPHIIASFSQPSVVISNLLHAAMLGITVIVVAVPEGLPMMITVVLSSNMRRMLKDHVLVRKLVGIETSGSINLLFTDKTGTLTKGKPEVSVFWDGAGKEYKGQELSRQKVLWNLVRLSGYYNTNSQLSAGEIVGGNSTDKALLSFIYGRQPLNTLCTVVKKIPFDSVRKWSGVEIKGDLSLPFLHNENHITLYKGAPDKLLKRCTYYLDPTGEAHSLISNTALYAIQDSLEKKAMRIVAFAVSGDSITDDPDNLTLVGLFGLRDELRSDVRKSISEVQKAGIQVVMITGDGKETATAIARSCGLLTDRVSHKAVLTSSQLASMSDNEVKELLPEIRVISRALPGDKSRLVRLSQEKGLVVGMTGDGINDAPALKKADVGFAMGSGTEVAKQAGDIVILKDSFSSISKAILYGRTIFKSIRKFIIFQLTMNLCAVSISILGPFIGVEVPVTMMQMLWINIIMDTLAGLAFAGEAPLPEYMKEPPKKREEPILNKYMLNQICFTGGFTVLLCIYFLVSPSIKALFRYTVNPLYWLTAFFALFIFTGIFNSFNTRTTRLNLLAHLRQNPSFVLIMALVAVVQLILIFYGGTLFRTAGMTGVEILRVILLSALVVPFDWIRKIIIRFNHRKGTL